MTKKRLEGEMACEAGFLVQVECLDASFESSTACFPMTVKLPGIDTEKHDYNLVAPFSALRARGDAADAAEAQYAGDSKWGCLQNPYDDPESAELRAIYTAAVVERLRFETEGKAGNDDELQDTVGHFGRDYAHWWPRFAEWIGVVSSQDLLRLGQKSRRAMLDVVSMWILEPADGDAPGFSTISFGDTRGYCGAPLSRAQLERCFALAGASKRPPLAWRLICDAHSLARHDEHRRATLDAATATELAVTELLDQYAIAANSPTVTRQIEKTKMLGNLLGLVAEKMPQTVSPSLSEQAKEQVAKPRNRAIHEGVPLSKKEAEAAVTTARQLVEAAYPLSTYGFHGYSV
ncbi:hypothetical protein ACJH6J_29635 [Mycobacterium sp. SMC-18]|uniref:hypothetical protein n=1 Tax=Mycobacterium sp. SMC-18 TaxID=3381629 RepID=UPI003875BDB5